MLLKKFNIVIHLKRVLVKIGWIIELQRVNKDRGYDNVSMSMRKIKKGGVTLMQRSHCGNHGNCLAIYSTGVNSLTEFMRSTENLHRI